MKTAVVLLGLLVVIAMPVTGNEFRKQLFDTIKICQNILKAKPETMKNFMEGTNFLSKENSCITACILEQLNVLKNLVIDLDTAVDDISKSHNFDHRTRQGFTSIAQNCKTLAEKTNIRCLLAGEFVHCLKENL